MKGDLITAGSGRGAADRQQAAGVAGTIWDWIFSSEHIGHDVEQFEMAHDLDGSTHGSHVEQYVGVRPLIY